MSIDTSRVCVHGALRRQCEACQLADDLEVMTAERDKLRAEVEACRPYLKDGESPAECIARNRNDVDLALSLLAEEKRRATQQADTIKALECNIDGWSQAFSEQLDRARRAEAEVASAVLRAEQAEREREQLLICAQQQAERLHQAEASIDGWIKMETEQRALRDQAEATIERLSDALSAIKARLDPHYITPDDIEAAYEIAKEMTR